VQVEVLTRRTTDRDVPTCNIVGLEREVNFLVRSRAIANERTRTKLACTTVLNNTVKSTDERRCSNRASERHRAVHVDLVCIECLKVAVNFRIRKWRPFSAAIDDCV